MTASQANAIQILIADDQTISRSGLRNLLEATPGFQVVGEAQNGAEAVEMVSSLQPDIVLMDLRMPIMNGIEATRRIHRDSPHIGILVVTIFQDDTSIFPAIRAGARGYLLKDTDEAELQEAIRTVARGGVIFSPGIAQQVLRYLSKPPSDIPKDVFDELTEREREILDWLARGYSNPEIAEQLGISPKTVSNNISNVLTKLHIVDRAKLMLMALEAGMGRSSTV